MVVGYNSDNSTWSEPATPREIWLWDSWTLADREVAFLRRQRAEPDTAEIATLKAELADARARVECRKQDLVAANSLNQDMLVDAAAEIARLKAEVASLRLKLDAAEMICAALDAAMKAYLTSRQPVA